MEAPFSSYRLDYSSSSCGFLLSLCPPPPPQQRLLNPPHLFINLVAVDEWVQHICCCSLTVGKGL